LALSERLTPLQFGSSNNSPPDRLSFRRVDFFRLLALQVDKGPLEVIKKGVTWMSDHGQVLYVVALLPTFDDNVVPSPVRSEIQQALGHLILDQ
jgi:hypothetical protein